MGKQILVGNDEATAIEQRVTAGNQFDGTAPNPASLSYYHLINRYAPGAAGGLFNFEQDKNVVVTGICVDTPNKVGTLTIEVVDVNKAGVVDEASAYIVHTGNMNFEIVPAWIRVILAKGQALRIKTAGCTQPVHAIVWARKEVGGA